MLVAEEAHTKATSDGCVATGITSMHGVVSIPREKFDVFGKFYAILYIFISSLMVTKMLNI